MKDIQQIIKNHITQALDTLEIPYDDTSVLLEHPADIAFGDYSTNVAFLLAKSQTNNIQGDYGVKVRNDFEIYKGTQGTLTLPQYFASQIKLTLETNLPVEIQKIEVAGPGFINFYLSEEFFSNTTKSIIEHENSWGYTDLLHHKKVLVEHSSPNLFKPFHIGHVMNNTIGESIVRLARFGGADVVTMSYPSDVSLGIGKAVYVLLADGLEKVQTLETLQEKLDYLGDCYVRGTKLYEEDASVQTAVKSITQKIFEHTPGVEYDAYTLGKTINLDYFKTITTTLGSHFDDFIYESEAGAIGKDIVLAHTPAIFTQSEGAVIYQGEQDGLHTRVFINKEGYPTYEAKDTGLLSLKFEKYNPDISIFITDHEQTDYFKVVSTAAGKIHKAWQDKTIHRTHGRMTFKGQKMSSRLGGVPTAKEILGLLTESVHEVAKYELTEKDTQSIAIAALKYSILKVQAGKNINFDPETSLSFEGDSGPYLLYSTLRAKSLLEKGESEGIVYSFKRPVDSEVTHLEKMLYRFPEVISQAIREYAPHHVVGYVTELAGIYNTWYAHTKIIKAETEAERGYYMALSKSFYITMQKGLYSMGIEIPEKM